MQNAVIYARYSDPQQRETSIEDQVRVCNQFAQREGLTVADVYHDKAITGAVRARPGYLQMLEDAMAGRVGVLIVHDLSRLSRDDYELKGLLRRFLWQDIRVIGVADGYDSARQGHKIHAGFKGLMNEMHLDDIRAWTLKGMRTKAEEGYNCGGRTYGYRNVPIEHPDGKKDAYGRIQIVAVRYEIDESQAAVVRQIHSWYAQGRSYAWIADQLNRQRVSSSRGGTWAVSAVKVILENPMYEGRLVWNRRTWARHPDTGKRTYKERPPQEWIVKENPELRIVPGDVIVAVRARQQKNQDAYGGAAVKPLSHRYLFSGILVCAHCGGSFSVVAHGRYGCATYKSRGSIVCGNSVTVSRHLVEERLLADIRRRLLSPASVVKFNQAAVHAIEQRQHQDEERALEAQLKSAQRERDNIMAAIKAGILTATTKASLESAESTVQSLEREIKARGEASVSGMLPRATERYQRAVAGLAEEFAGHVPQAREILKSLVGERIRVHRRGDHLEAELQHSMTAIFARMATGPGTSADLGGCGGAICSESVFVSLEPRSRDSAPLKHRRRKKIQGDACGPA